MALNHKPAIFYNVEKHVNCTLILKVNHACYAHITDCELIAYQRIQAPFTHEMKAYKISFLFDIEGLLNQARTGQRPACAWFLKIDPVRIVGMCA